MKILKKIFGNKDLNKTIQAKTDNSSSSKPKKLTKTKEREFFKLVKDEDLDHSELIADKLIDFPALANSTVSGMAKGIDGFSSLMLAIRFYNFDVAKILVQNGANVNFIDTSDVRQNHFPIFFDFIEMMRDLIEAKNFDEVNKGFELWDIMDSNGLDYSIKSICNDGVNQPDSFVEAYIRLIGVKYGNKHLVHNETKYDPPNPYVNIFIFSKESQDDQKENYYRQMARRIVNRVNMGQLKEIDANRFRWWSSSILPFYIENGFVDSFSLSIVNDLTKEKHGFELQNINDINHLQKNVDKQITRFANNV